MVVLEDLDSKAGHSTNGGALGVFGLQEINKNGEKLMQTCAQRYFKVGKESHCR